MACHVIENDDRSFNSANDMKIWSLYLNKHVNEYIWSYIEKM